MKNKENPNESSTSRLIFQNNNLWNLRLGLNQLA